MKKSKERKDILKQAGGGIFLYLFPCLIGVYESYYRNADLRITVRIAECVIFFIVTGAIVSLIKKEYDPRKYNGYVTLFASLGLILQIMLQGGILALTLLYVFISFHLITDVIVEPDYRKRLPGTGQEAQK